MPCCKYVIQHLRVLASAAHSPKVRTGSCLAAILAELHQRQRSNRLLLLQVCNHPDLFEGRSIISAFDMLPAISLQEPSAILNLLQQDPASTVSLGSLGSAGPALQSMSAWEAAEVQVCLLSYPCTWRVAHKHRQESDQGSLKKLLCVRWRRPAEFEGSRILGLMHSVPCRRWRHQACSFTSWLPPLSTSRLNCRSLLR